MGTIEVPLTQGRVALVDEQDSFVLQYRWSAVYRHGVWYATRHGNDGEPAVVYLHQEVLKAPLGLTVDHANGDGLDNRRENLRVATQQQQCWNRRSVAKTSPFKGVSWGRDPKRRAGGRWICKIKPPLGRAIVKHLHSEIEAARLYNTLARQYFGEFARLNVIPKEIA